MKRENRLSRVTKPNIIILFSILALAVTEFGIFNLQIPHAVAGLLDRAEPFCINPACNADVKTLDIDVLLRPAAQQVIRDTRNGTMFTLGINGTSLDDAAS